MTTHAGSLGVCWRVCGLDVSLTYLFEAAPSEALIFLLVFLALQRFDFLGVLDYSLIVKLDLRFFVRGLCEVLLLRLGLRSDLDILLLLFSLALFGGSRLRSSRWLALLGFLLLFSLLCKNVLYNLLLVTHLLYSMLELINLESNGTWKVL